MRVAQRGHQPRVPVIRMLKDHRPSNRQAEGQPAAKLDGGVGGVSRGVGLRARVEIDLARAQQDLESRLAIELLQLELGEALDETRDARGDEACGAGGVLEAVQGALVINVPRVVDDEEDGL